MDDTALARLSINLDHRIAGLLQHEAHRARISRCEQRYDIGPQCRVLRQVNGVRIVKKSRDSTVRPPCGHFTAGSCREGS